MSTTVKGADVIIEYGRNGGWSFLPPNRALAKNEVHVWLAALDSADFESTAVTDCLSSAERERAARFKFTADRRRYVVAHAALRSILSFYLAVKCNDIEFSSGSAGKPKLSRPSGGDVEFNLSHSGELALVAVTRGEEIGVDIERIREDFAFKPIAQRFFTASEVAALEDLPAERQREAFYQCWTSKEALLKAKGTGLSGALDEVQIVLTAEAAVRITFAAGEWCLPELSPIEGYAAALAAKRIDCQLKGYRWQPSLLELQSGS